MEIVLLTHNYYSIFRFNPDRIHQERLATYRLSQRKRHKLKFQSDANKVMKGTVITDLMTGVIKEMSWKQAQEREVDTLI